MKNDCEKCKKRETKKEFYFMLWSRLLLIILIILATFVVIKTFQFWTAYHLAQQTQLQILSNTMLR